GAGATKDLSRPFIARVLIQRQLSGSCLATRKGHFHGPRRPEEDSWPAPTEAPCTFTNCASWTRVFNSNSCVCWKSRHSESSAWEDKNLAQLMCASWQEPAYPRGRSPGGKYVQNCYTGLLNTSLRFLRCGPGRKIFPNWFRALSNGIS